MMTHDDVANELLRAGRALLAHCDGAHERDDVGFNAADAGHARKLLAKYELDEDDFRDLYFTLLKYEGQLLNYGINYRELYAPEVRKAIQAPPHPSTESIYLHFGKNKGKSLAELARKDRGYLQWLSEAANFFDPYWPAAAAATLDGKPVTPKDQPAAKAGGAEPVSTKPRLFAVDEEWLAVTFPYNPTLVARIKAEVRGRVWNKDEKRWELPYAEAPSLVAIFGEGQLEMDDAAREALGEVTTQLSALNEIRTQLDAEIELPIAMSPFGYQKVGVQFALQAGGRVGIFDDVGLGKTLQAAAFALYIGAKTLVVCPAAVKLNWRKKLQQIRGVYCEKCQTHARKLEHTCATVWDGSGPDTTVETQFHIVNPENFIKHKTAFEAMGFEILVLDEAHYFTNRKARRTLAIFGGTETKKVAVEGKSYKRKETVKHTRFNTKYCVMLTATPVNNHPAEFFPLLNYLRPDLFNNFWSYGHEYGAFSPGNLQGLPSTPKNLVDLHERTKSFVIRRTEDDVKSERPKAIESELWVQLEPKQRREYEKLVKQLLGDWQNAKKPTLAAMHPLREWLNGVKLEMVYETIDELLANDKPVVLFATRIEPLKKVLAKYGEKAGMIDGSMSLKARQREIDAFEAGERMVECISIRAGGTGIDGLQHKSHHMIFLDLDWVPSLHHQAKGRLDRTGQQYPVHVWYAMVENTVDEYLKEIIERKLAITSQMTDGKLRKVTRKKSVFKEFVTRLKRDYKEIEAMAEADDSDGGVDESLIEEEAA